MENIKGYNVLPLDLTNGLSNYQFDMVGKKLFYKSGNSTIQIRFNEITADAISMHPYDKMVHPFNRLYITASPAAETINLIILNDDTLDFQGNQILGQSVSITNAPHVTAIDTPVQIADTAFTQIIADYSGAAASTTLHTVAAGKTFVLDYFSVANNAGVAGTTLQVTDAGDVGQYEIAVLIPVGATVSGRPNIHIQAGWKIKLVLGAGVTGHGFICGHEI